MIESLGGSEKPKAIIDLLPMIHVTDPNWAISAGDHSFDATEKAKALAFMDALLQFASLKSGRVKETRPKRIEMKKRKRKEEGEEGVKKEEDGEKEEEEEEEEEIEIIEEEVKHKWLFTKPERVDPLIQQCIIDTFTEVEVETDAIRRIATANEETQGFTRPSHYSSCLARIKLAGGFRTITRRFKIENDGVYSDV